jgi:hypothetical protein
MATQFMTTKILSQFVAVMLKNQGALTMQIGGLASNPNWALAYPNKGQGNNLNIVPETATSVRVKAGTIWDGAAARTLASDVVVGSLTTTLPNHLYAVNSGGSIVVQKVAGFGIPTPPVNTIKEIGVVDMDFDARVFQIITLPSMINQIASVTPTVTLIGYNKLSPPSSGSYAGSNPTNAIQVAASFNLPGTNNVGEYALTLNASGMSSSEVNGQSYILAYLAQDTQVSIVDSLLNVTWNLAVNEPSAFYP